MSKDGRTSLVVVFALISLGLVMTYSASAVFAEQRLGQASYYFWRQIIFSVLGFLTLLSCLFLNPMLVRRYSRWYLVIAVFLLSLVFLPLIGAPSGGARRWIQVLGVNFQPAEFVKLALCIYLADYLSRKRDWIKLGRMDTFIAPVCLLLVLGGMVIVQPDFGTALLLCLMTGLMLFLAGMRLRYIVWAVAVVVPVVVVSILAKPYRLSRVLTFLDPLADPQGSGFQIIQSYIAFGLGGWNGVGLGAGTQKLFYLPLSHTDFIFPIIGEELGLLGTTGALLLFGLFLYFGLRIALKSQDAYSRLLALSLVWIVVIQAMANMSVVTGLIPTKGLPLPFVSYGGSAMLFNMAAVGLILGIDRRTVRRCALY